MASTDTLHRLGLMFILSSPSGAGKTTIARQLLRHDPEIRMSVSVTTRPMRPGEVDGKDYFFVDQAEFDRMVEEEHFLEWAEVFGNCYGTPKAHVRAGLKEGQDFLFDVDWQGAQQIRRAVPDCQTIFILPPSRRSLEERLRNRKTDSEEVIARRLRDSIADMSHYAEFDRVIVNDDWETAVRQLLEILSGRPGYEASRPELKPLIADLLG